MSNPLSPIIVVGLAFALPPAAAAIECAGCFAAPFWMDGNGGGGSEQYTWEIVMTPKKGSCLINVGGPDPCKELSCSMELEYTLSGAGPGVDVDAFGAVTDPGGQQVARHSADLDWDEDEGTYVGQSTGQVFAACGTTTHSSISFDIGGQVVSHPATALLGCSQCQD